MNFVIDTPMIHTLSAMDGSLSGAHAGANPNAMAWVPLSSVPAT
jgi:hypothetical protein